MTVRYGCEVFHGPNISNFSEIYKFLNKNNLSKKFQMKNLANLLL